MAKKIPARSNKIESPAPTWDLGVLMNTAASKLIMLETGIKKNPVLTRKDLSVILKRYVRNTNDLDSPTSVSRICLANCQKRNSSLDKISNRPQSTMKTQERINNINGKKLYVKNILRKKGTMQLKDTAFKRKVSTIETRDTKKIDIVKQFLYEAQITPTHYYSPQKIHKTIMVDNKSFEARAPNTQILMPLVSQIKAANRKQKDPPEKILTRVDRIKNYSRAYKTGNFANTLDSSISATIPKTVLRCENPLPAVKYFPVNVTNIYNFTLDLKDTNNNNTNSLLNKYDKSLTEASVTPKKKKVEILKDNAFNLSNKIKQNIIKLKIPIQCHLTKRIKFAYREKAQDYPILVINFDGILGDVFQKSWWESNEIGFYIKPRIFL